jgi:hypothetical protein
MLLTKSNKLYNAPFLVNVGKFVSVQNNDADITLIQRDHFHRKTIHAYSALVNLGNLVVTTVDLPVMLSESDICASTLCTLPRNLCPEPR